MGNDVTEAVIELLLSDTELADLVTDVVHISGEQESAYPLCVVTDLPGRPSYTSGGIDTEKSFINVEVIALPTDTASAYTNAKDARNRVRELLEELDENLVTEEGNCICFRRSQELSSMKDVQSGSEIYVRKGDEYEVVIEK